MRLHVIGTGSSGNCYLLQSSDGAVLMLECGVRWRTVTKYLTDHNMKISDIAGCLLTHEHGDHALAAKDVMKAGINIYTKKETAIAIGLEDQCNHLAHFLDHLKCGFSFISFNVYHDAVKPVGFIIDHIEIGRIVFATDTKFIPFVIRYVGHYIIEANYSEKYLQENIADESVSAFIGNRIYENHMSLETCIDYLRDNIVKTKTITIIHLSTVNAWGEEFKTEVAKATGIMPNIAENNTIFEL